MKVTVKPWLYSATYSALLGVKGGALPAACQALHEVDNIQITVNVTPALLHVLHMPKSPL